MILRTHIKFIWALARARIRINKFPDRFSSIKCLFLRNFSFRMILNFARAVAHSRATEHPIDFIIGKDIVQCLIYHLLKFQVISLKTDEVMSKTNSMPFLGKLSQNQLSRPWQGPGSELINFLTDRFSSKSSDRL